MARKIDWLNHSLEFFVVVVGILLAFQLEKCAELRTQQATLQNHFVEIEAEVATNIQQMELSLDYISKSVAYCDSVLLLINRAGPVADINSLSFQLLSIQGAYIQDNAYRSLVESGDIRFIKDFDTKNRIISLYEFFDYVRVFDKIALESYSSYYYPYVMEHLDLVNYLPQERPVYENIAFLNAVSAYKYTLNLSLRKYLECADRMREFSIN